MGLQYFFIFATFVAAVQLAELHDQSNENCGLPELTSASLIVNGTQSKRGSWPWLVSIYRIKDEQFFCAGTLISLKHVLTAAQCMQSKHDTNHTKEEIVIHLGEYNQNDKNESGRVFNHIEEMFVHEEWNVTETRYDADIAMLKMDSAVKQSVYIIPICLPEINDELSSTIGVISGWGKTEDKSLLHSLTPFETKTEIVDVFTCIFANSLMANIISRRTFCAGGNGKGPCSGDAGGGLFVKHQNSWYLKGIVSTSLIKSGECDVNSHAVYTDVPKYTSWINQKMLL